jgi:diaminopimelate decarboxylase
MREDLPFSKAEIENLAQEHPTPFYVYDGEGIRKGAQIFNTAFANAGLAHMNYFAVKALPNPHILRLLAEEGMGADCSSMPELHLAQMAGVSGENIMFTSNNTPAAEFREAANLGAIINFDDITHLLFYREHVGQLPEIGCARYNPGNRKKDGNSIIGKPEEAKYGATHEQIIEMYRQMRDGGVNRFGIHTMVASNCLDSDSLVETADILFRLIAEIRQKIGITFEFANIGGGFGIPYKPDQEPLSVNRIAQGIKKRHDEILGEAGHPPVRIFTENGRWVTGPHGYLVTRAIHHKDTYKSYIGVDACMANLMRPGMYGAYHHIVVLGKENEPKTHKYDVTGSLCENCDKFAIDRELPEIEEGDLLAVEDSGAHGSAMGFRYNGKLAAAEFLLEVDERGNRTYRMIRRAETEADYFSTLV